MNCKSCRNKSVSHNSQRTAYNNYSIRQFYRDHTTAISQRSQVREACGAWAILLSLVESLVLKLHSSAEESPKKVVCTMPPHRSRIDLARIGWNGHAEHAKENQVASVLAVCTL